MDDEGVTKDILRWSLVGMRRHYGLCNLFSSLLHVSRSLNVRIGSIKIRLCFNESYILPSEITMKFCRGTVYNRIVVFLVHVSVIED